VSRLAGLLTAGQRESLERDGYLLVPSLLDEMVLAPMRARLDELVHRILVAWDADPRQDVEERGVVHAKLGLSGPDFAPCRLSAMWCISAFTPANGPLRVIPGSHRVDRHPADALPLGCEMGPHPAEVKVVAPAGSLILFNGADLWHSGTFNYSPAPRLALTVSLLCGRAPVHDVPARP
jgi:hypothetical protein